MPNGGRRDGEFDVEHDRSWVHVTQVPADDLGAVSWRKSVASNPNGDCVELALLPAGGVAVRNSRGPHGAALIYTRAEIAAFLRGAKAGEFDDLV
jgi:hypothetical protein